MKRVCMIAYTFYEADNRVRRYAEALAERGDLVDIIALANPSSSFRDHHSRFEKLKGVNVFRIQKRKLNEKRPVSYLLRILTFLFRSSFFLLRKNLIHKYDVIHVHSVPDFEVFATLIPKLMGSRIILDIHDIVPEFYISKFHVGTDSLVYRLLLLIEKLSIAYSHHLIIANHIWQKKLISRAVEEEKCSVFLNYPDQKFFYERHKQRKDDKIVIIYPGSLNQHQGLDVAIRAIGQVAGRKSEVHFHIYGEGPGKLQLDELIDDLGLRDVITIRPYVSLDKIADVIAEADIGLVPKRKDSFGNEAFSTKIFEFMSIGVPVVVSDTKIDKYYFDDGSVLFFQSGNDSDLAEKILYLIEHRDIREQLVRKGHECIGENNWDAHKDRYFRLIDSL